MPRNPALGRSWGRDSVWEMYGFSPLQRAKGWQQPLTIPRVLEVRERRAPSTTCGCSGAADATQVLKDEVLHWHCDFRWTKRLGSAKPKFLAEQIVELGAFQAIVSAGEGSTGSSMTTLDFGWPGTVIRPPW